MHNQHAWFRTEDHLNGERIVWHDVEFDVVFPSELADLYTATATFGQNVGRTRRIPALGEYLYHQGNHLKVYHLTYSLDQDTITVSAVMEYPHPTPEQVDEFIEAAIQILKDNA